MRPRYAADEFEFIRLRLRQIEAANPLTLSDFLREQPAGVNLRALIESCDLPFWSEGVVTTGSDHFLLVWRGGHAD